jgi:putative tryptophan/tyrosine transport system substrate-binding protein
MNRRAFMARLGGVTAWPLVAHAQQNKIHRIGVLILGNADAETIRKEMPEGLRDSGYLEGKNILFDFRSAEGRIDVLPKLATELVASRVDVIVAVYTPCALAAQQATHEIPIVIVSGDPIGTGLVASLARPSGNITGISLMAPELHGKCVELLRDMLPSAHRIAMLGNVADPSWKQILDQVQLAGKAAGIEIAPIKIVGAEEIDAAFAVMVNEGASAVVVQGSFSRQSVAESALSHRLPSATVPRSFAEVGGLMAYGSTGPEIFRQAAFFVAKILKGGKPEDMPVEQPTTFQFVINLKTAKALGVTVPPRLLGLADDVIE